MTADFHLHQTIKLLAESPTQLVATPEIRKKKCLGCMFDVDNSAAYRAKSIIYL